MTKPEHILKLEDKASEIRRHVIRMLHSAGSGHTGGSLSCTDILVALYFHVMKYNTNPDIDKNKSDQDRFILSKGHAAPALYATLAECGYFALE